MQPPLSPPPVTLAPPAAGRAEALAADPPRISPVPPAFDPPPTTPEREPEPVTTLPPPRAPEPAPPPAAALYAAPTAHALHRVLVRLTTGDVIEVAAHEDEAGARREATALMRYLRDDRGDWPFLAGRFVRPETIVSVDVD